MLRRHVPNWRDARLARALRNDFKFETSRANYAYDFGVCELRVFGGDFFWELFALRLV